MVSAPAVVGMGSIAMEAERPRCLFCSAVLGVYDPLLVVDHDGDRETSLAAEPELATRARVLLAHRECARPVAAETASA